MLIIFISKVSQWFQDNIVAIIGTRKGWGELAVSLTDHEELHDISITCHQALWQGHNTVMISEGHCYWGGKQDSDCKSVTWSEQVVLGIFKV